MIIPEIQDIYFLTATKSDDWKWFARSLYTFHFRCETAG